MKQTSDSCNTTKYNFDEIIDRRGSGALKTDRLTERYGRNDLTALWVADMDFRCGDFITDAIRKRCDEGIFGYNITPDSYLNSIVNWVKNRHGWAIEKQWLSYIPGIVKGIALTIMHFTKPNDKVIIQPPVYHPFRLVPQMQGREVVFNPLIESNGRYKMDLEGLKRVIDKDCKILILCNPHNPAGIIWDKETLAELARICRESNILVISDEIHADMRLFGHKYWSFATVSDDAAQNSITFMAPSKTFNIAGIVSSYSIIPNPEIRKSFYDFLQAGELDEGTIFSYLATEAAYTKGVDWMNEMLKYIEGNILFVDDFLKKNIPQIKAVIPEASFLLWLDCRALGLNQRDLNALFVEKAHLALNDGEMFGREGIGFMRMNIGSPRKILEKALIRLKDAIDEK
ncbi:MAG: PatB family C-S lyase [Dysgonamonadaceae bacterium]|jgi:cystathionine beta-lyase|nr:PatB family C-S lyase [Dysgonamonadaceae bacterium]